MVMADGILEKEFARQVTDLAHIYGWSFVHFRPAKTKHGWRTPVEGPLGLGWPDWVFVRARDRRLLFAELKRDGRPLEPEQVRVLDVLRSLATAPGLRPPLMRGQHARVDVVCWRPSDLESGDVLGMLS